MTLAEVEAPPAPPTRARPTRRAGRTPSTCGPSPTACARAAATRNRSPRPGCTTPSRTTRSPSSGCDEAALTRRTKDIVLAVTKRRGRGAGGVRAAHPRHPGRTAGEGGRPGAQRRPGPSGGPRRAHPHPPDREVRTDARTSRPGARAGLSGRFKGHGSVTFAAPPLSGADKPRARRPPACTAWRPLRVAHGALRLPASRASSAASLLNAHSIFGSIDEPEDPPHRRRAQHGDHRGRDDASRAISPSGWCSQACVEPAPEVASP